MFFLMVYKVKPNVIFKAGEVCAKLFKNHFPQNHKNLWQVDSIPFFFIALII